ncbi:GTP-binding protein [Candidatus Harpocratesius sp.]
MQTYKIAIVGDGGVGKSSLLDAKKSRNFISDKAITIGVDFDFIPIEKSKPEDGKAQFLVMDLGGQARFHFVHDLYIQGIKGAIVLFDVSRFKTFQNLKKWISLITKENSQIPILLIGNKCDLIECILRS